MVHVPVHCFITHSSTAFLLVCVENISKGHSKCILEDTMEFISRQALFCAVLATTTFGAAIPQDVVEIRHAMAQEQLDANIGKIGFCRDINFGGDCKNFTIATTDCCKLIFGVPHPGLTKVVRHTDSFLLQMILQPSGTMFVLPLRLTVDLNASFTRKCHFYILVFSGHDPQVQNR